MRRRWPTVLGWDQGEAQQALSSLFSKKRDDDNRGFFFAYCLIGPSRENGHMEEEEKRGEIRGDPPTTQ